jgi:tetratricopeptide (TPR) repeat protein
MGQVYAVILDASFRLPIDPSGQYVVGLLDDTEIAFTSERWFSQQIAGIYCASGHLGGIKDAWPQYRETLLVARAYGCYDKTLERQLVNDKEYLDSHELIIKDWIFKGGHTLPPRETNEEVFLWLLENRKTALQIDMRLAQELSVKWQQDYNLGQGAYVFEECLRTELNNPCTWQAYQARKMLYELLDNYNLFSKYDLKNIKYSREVENYFCQIAYASILSADVKRLKSSLQILNEIGIKDSVWAANLSLAFMVSPHKETQSIRTACSIIERAMLFNKKDSSLKLIGAAICIKNGDYEGANKMYKRISNKKLTSKEKVALCEIAASIAEKKDKLNMYSFYKIMRF